MSYKITRNHLLSDIPLTEFLSRAEVAHVSHHCHCMVTSCLLHLTDLLPGVVLLVVLQDVCTATTSPWKYMVITKHGMYNIIVIENDLTEYEDVILQ